MGIIDRGGKVRAEVASDNRKATPQGRVRDVVEPGASVFTDALPSYGGLDSD